MVNNKGAPDLCRHKSTVLLATANMKTLLLFANNSITQYRFTKKYEADTLEKILRDQTWEGWNTACRCCSGTNKKIQVSTGFTETTKVFENVKAGTTEYFQSALMANSLCLSG